ncbi:glycan biosynthesis hexose transferase WsfD [Actinomycetospora sp. NBC_00405]|uniref:glycan biosynthesis hexose transferase WsfD n=1 Tax=Actinomycetospora sp. NBC_00405 TaxID=2975952 RepID=UPI002E1FD057
MGHGTRRIALSLGAGVAAASLVVLTLGLPTGRTFGVEDNGDGFRLFCGLGMVPRTVDRIAAWKGGVVTDFAVVASPTCGMSTPSSAALVLRAAMLGGDGSVALSTVAWWYAALVGLVVASAAWAASASGPGRAAVLLVPVAPLALPAFTRFFVSTYGEPAGLLGALAVACGVAALLVTRPEQRAARTVALTLTALGGAVAATAKVGYLPVLVAAVVACAVVTVGRRRRLGPVIALVTVLAVAVPVGAAVQFQDQVYGGANVHDVVFTLALPELGPDGPAALGLPPEAADVAGDGFFNGPPLPTADWWVRAIGEDADATRAAAHGALIRHPDALLRGLGAGLQATTRADLPYLAAGPGDPARPTGLGGDAGWSGSRGPALREVLDDTPWPAWLPTALVLLAAAAAGTSVLWRRREPAAARWCLAAGLAAVTALGLVAAAVLGDGYFEVFKHVWLAAYLLVLSGLGLLGAGGAVVCRALRVRYARRPASAL